MPNMEDKKKNTFPKLIEELKRNCKRNWFKQEEVSVYAKPKCSYCNNNRIIHAIAANGQELIDECKCGEETKEVWTVRPYTVDAFVIPESDDNQQKLRISLVGGKKCQRKKVKLLKNF